jgi:hypothetical protein
VYDIYYTYSTLLPANLLTSLHVLPHFPASFKTVLFQDRFGKTCFNILFSLNVLIVKVQNFVTLFTTKIVIVADDYPYIFLIVLVEPAPPCHRCSCPRSSQSFPPVPREITGYSARNPVARASFAVIREGKVDIWLRRVCMISRTGPHAVNSCM